MSPEEIKSKIQSEFIKSLNNTNSMYSRNSYFPLFQDVRLYGYDSGRDFAETHISEIVEEAVQTAKTKKTELELSPYRFGTKAIDGFADGLRELTSLKVDIKGSKVVIIWGDATPRLVDQ